MRVSKDADDKFYSGNDIDFSKLASKDVILQKIKRISKTVSNLSVQACESNAVLLYTLECKINIVKLWCKNGSSQRAMNKISLVIEEFAKIPIEDYTTEMFRCCFAAQMLSLKIAIRLYDAGSILKVQKVVHKYLLRAIVYIKDPCLLEEHNESIAYLIKNVAVRKINTTKRSASARLHRVNIIFDDSANRPKTNRCREKLFSQQDAHTNSGKRVNRTKFASSMKL